MAEQRRMCAETSTSPEFRAPARTVDDVPRPPRIEVEDGIFHVATRSVDEAFAYRGIPDRLDFLEFLWTTVATYEWNCQSYCLMGTHYHLIVQTPQANLSAGMQMLNGRYAQRFNWRHGRRGHLFGARFMSVHVEDDAHLMAAHRYVARNPVRAGLCLNPGDWRWSSYRALVGLERPPFFLDVEGALGTFGGFGLSAQVVYARTAAAASSPLDDLPYKLAETAGV
jgi:putative transposase